MMNEEFLQQVGERKASRELSAFLAQEMLLDYLDGHLDPQRRAAVDRRLSHCRDTQNALRELQRGRAYAAELGKIEPSLGLIQRVMRTKAGWAKWADRLSWSQLPETARWSVEALVISVVVAVLVTALPVEWVSRWLPSPTTDVVLTEVDSEFSPADESAEDSDGTAAALAEAMAPKLAQDAKLAQNTKPMPVKPAAPTPPPQVATPSTAPTLPKPAAAPPSPVVKPADSATAEEEAATSNESESAESETTTTAAAAAAPARTRGPKGIVFRAFMGVTDLEINGEGVKQLVESLGGEKAGQVELGHRQQLGRYYHFTLPEANYDALMDGLKTFGPVRILKDTHWRVMPEGQVRIILVVKELK